MNPPGPYRLTRRQIRFHLLIAYGPCLPVVAAMELFLDLGLTRGDILFILFGPTLAVLIMPYVTRRHRVRLTEAGIRFRGGLRHHHVLWTEIAHLVPSPLLGVRRIVIHTTRGKRHVLPAPLSFVDPEFDRKAREITDWWHQHRA
ncbi:hypothetical protein ABZX85_01110 [Streptomyces sp. NPDC004539]|uniref:hypothetical protein n=1 Tax=Streptomyces sp. NPDC004539 TaxID=3154280 RepID=UPI00339E40D7